MSHNKGIDPDRETNGHGYSDTSLPSYNEATSSGSRLDQVPPELPGFDIAQDSIEQLLKRLPLQVRSARQEQLGRQQDNERLLIERLIPYITDFIRNLPRSVLYPQHSQRPLSAELILLPANAVPAEQGWALSGLHERKEHAAHVQVIDITSPEKYNLDSLDRKRPDAFAEVLGEDWKGPLWWHDEDLADRLASHIRLYLQPEDKSEPESHTSADNEKGNGQEKKKDEGGTRHGGFTSRKKPHSSLFFGRSKKSYASTGHGELGSHPLVSSSVGNAKKDFEVVKVTIRREEVTFRRENVMGLWESSSGWAIILAVAVTL